MNATTAAKSAPKPRSLAPLVAIFLIALAPVVFAVLAYYVPALGLRPETRTHAGQLVSPQRPTPGTLGLTDLQGQPVDLATYRGQWLLISTGPGACPETCVRGLYVLRNAHASQGKNVDRLSRVWLVTDDAPINPVAEHAYVGTDVLRADPVTLAQWLVPGAAASQAALQTGLWVVDPLGNLMMMFPDTQNPEAVRDDLRTLLRNSRIG